MMVAHLVLAVLMQAPASGPVEVEGRVVDAKGQPIAEAKVTISGLRRLDGIVARGTSDVQGRFRLTMPALEDAQIADLPWAACATHEGYGLESVVFTRQSVAKAEAEPLLVKLAVPEGSAVRVVGPSGAAVEGAKVLPITVRAKASPGSVLPGKQVRNIPLPDELAERLAATTGPDGRGTMASVSADVLKGVRVEAPGSGRQQAISTAGPDGTFEVKLAPVGRLSGRIVVDDPKSLQGLTVSIFSWPAEVGLAHLGQVAVGGMAEIVPDESGRFEVPALAIGKLTINVQAPENSQQKFSIPLYKAVSAGLLTEVTIIERRPIKTRTLTGRVVDSKGEAVEGALVFQSGDAPSRTEATSDVEGRFSLSGVVETSTFVFAQARGYRFAGRGVKAGEKDVTIVLTGEDEPPGETMATLAPVASPEKESALAHRLIDAYATKVMEKGDTNDKFPTLEVLARLDPVGALELIEERPLKEPALKSMIRMQIASALTDTAPDDALAVAESITDPWVRGLALLRAADARLPAKRAEALDVLNRALVNAKAAQKPTGIRMILEAQVAEHWLDMGLTEKAAALLREVQHDAEQLPDAAWPGYAKGAFAEELCQIDLDAALKLTEGLSDANEFDRHHGNIAHELAGKDPEAAERVLGMVKQPRQHDQYTVRAVYRMAPFDLPRARRLATSTVDPVMRGYAFGMGALGLADKKRAADATALLREAMDTLSAAGEYGQSPTRSPCDRVSTAASLVAVAEQIDPGLVPETFWRALSLRYPRKIDDAGNSDAVFDLRLALLLARYDRDVARELVAPFVGPEKSAAYFVGDRGLAFAAAAVIDPEWAARLVEGLRDAPDVKANRLKNSARLAVSAVLARHGEARWRYLQNHFAYLWVADIEDIAPDL